MSFTPSNELSSYASTTDYVLKSFRHGTRLFVDNQFALLPKKPYLFHVAFDINPAAIITPELLQQHRNEIGMLVKSVDLPKFEVTTNVLNQYNRKTVVQQTHKMSDVTVMLHNDNMGLINEVWRNYYMFYYSDSITAHERAYGGYTRNAMQDTTQIREYGHRGRSFRFFNSITIYHMSRHEYVSYTLVNPLIKSFGHSSLEYMASDHHNFEMVIAYESVDYNTGVVADGSVAGFGDQHYDNLPSPWGAGSVTSQPSFAIRDKASTQTEIYTGEIKPTDKRTPIYDYDASVIATETPVQ